jgi:hypothetical protein
LDNPKSYLTDFAKGLVAAPAKVAPGSARLDAEGTMRRATSGGGRG